MGACWHWRRHVGPHNATHRFGVARLPAVHSRPAALLVHLQALSPRSLKAPSKLGLGRSSVQDGLQLHCQAHAALNLELAQQEGLRVQQGAAKVE